MDEYTINLQTNRLLFIFILSLILFSFTFQIFIPFAILPKDIAKNI